MPAAVTPSGVRDGDPAALAGLCAVRGPSVLAYCRQIAGDAHAGAAAADAFARFRAEVVDTDDLSNLNPEALLINATRRTAAGHAPRAPLGVCAVVPLLLAARADRSISIGELEILEEHLADCWACRAPVARFQAAERAYRDPPDPSIDPEVGARIVAAMAAAVPADGDEATVAASANGGAADSPEAGVLPVRHTDEPQPVEPLDHPTTEFRAADVLDPDPESADVAASNGVVEPDRPGGRKRGAASLLGSLGLRSGESDLRLAPRVDEPEPEDELVLEGLDEPERAPTRARAMGAHLPRGRRTPASRAPKREHRRDRPSPIFSSSARSRSRKRLPLTVVLPVAVVVLALALALFVSGVVGGDDPASSPSVNVPSDAPAQSEAVEADVIVVPRDGAAGADDVEAAKARERARAQRKRDATVARESAGTTPVSPPPAAVAPPPPPPADTSNNDRGDGTRGSRADAGAPSRAEQIPTPEDTSTVPDLVPAPEPAPAP
jgi:hypothetical protein